MDAEGVPDQRIDAADISAAQAQEIDEMKSWLALWYAL